MTQQPLEIDNAKVPRVADLSCIIPTKTRHVVEGRVVEDFAALAIAQYKRGEGVYLFDCDADWNSVTDTYHDNIQGAIAQAEFEFGPLKFVDVSGE